MCFFLEMKSALCGCVGAICLILLNVVNFSGLAFVNLCCGCLWKFVFFIGEWFEKCKQILGDLCFSLNCRRGFFTGRPSTTRHFFCPNKRNETKKSAGYAPELNLFIQHRFARWSVMFF